MSNLASRLAASESALSTILAKDRTLSCDTRQTGLNNNALVIGPSGAGKTRNVLKPNLLQMNASYIVLDTKGTLCREVGPVLAAHGYRVQCLNFADLNTVPALAPGIERCGYNPLSTFAARRTAGPTSRTSSRWQRPSAPSRTTTSLFGIMRRQTCCRVLSPTSPNSYPPTSRRSARSSS